MRRCINEGFACEKIAIEKIKHFISKDAINIDGLGKKVIDQLWNLKIIKTPSDIFQLNYHEIEKLEGWGDTSIGNLKKAVDVLHKDCLLYTSPSPRD